MKLLWGLVASPGGADSPTELLHLPKSLNVGSGLGEGWKSSTPSNRYPGQFSCCFFSPLLLQRACYFGAPLPSTASVLLLEDHGGLADCRPLHPV